MKPAVVQARIGWSPLLADAGALACALAVMIGVALDTSASTAASGHQAAPGVSATR